MTRRMLIDASQSEETRVVVLHGNRLEEFDYDSEAKKQLKGNIYLAKVTRVEPSLQAAFVEYGGNRHGFLAFNEIHPDYYKIPVADREQLIAEEADDDDGDDAEDPENVETVGGDELDEVDRRRTRMRRNYKIQEVTKRGQVMLVQVVKEERGNKGAALTTYLSLPGRYCVLMPNTGRGGGISRKISNPRDRKRLKTIVDGLGIPEGMAVIVRTAGSERTKAELKRDFEYLMRLWNEIRNDTLESTAPALIYEEANLIKRAIRDMYTKDIEDIEVEGDEGYRTAKDFMRTLMPSHAKRVQPYKNEGVPVFQRYKVEGQIDAIHSPEVKLRSGGYIVMHQTEALVAIDVNSGRATRERHIEETALKTNLEAADEVARQLRLRDLAGLIVIDFIDMEESRNNHTVERRLKDALRSDRARIQVGRISHFGLLEMSRQRLRPSLMEISSEMCPYCGGSGYIQSVEWTGLHVLRAIEEECLKKRSEEISVTMPAEAALYLLNQKRAKLNELENRYEMRILVVADNSMVAPNYSLDVMRGPGGQPSEDGAQERAGRRRRRGRRRRSQDADTATVEVSPDTTDEAADRPEAAAPKDGDEEAAPKRRKRGRRGGRRRGRKSKAAEAAAAETTEDTPSAEDTPTADAETQPQEADEAGATTAEADAIAEPANDDATGDAAEMAEQDKPAAKSRRASKSSKSTKSTKAAKTAKTAKTARKPAKPRRRRKSDEPAKPAADTTDAAEATGDAGDSGPAEIIEIEVVEAVSVEEDRTMPVEVAEESPRAEIELPNEAAASENGGGKALNETDGNGRDGDSPYPATEPDAEPATIAAETPREKRSGWWNRDT